jgi:hypothetical protein
MVLLSRLWSLEGGFITASWMALLVMAKRVIGAP